MMFSFNFILKLPALLVAVLFLTVTSSGAMAAGTLSGTNITNAATVTYDVAAIAQPAINSDNADFVVDNKVNLTISRDDTAPILATPGATGGVGVHVMTFTVENTGNTVQDFALSSSPLTGGTGVFLGIDNVNADIVTIYVEKGGAGYQLSDNDIYIDELAPGIAIKVYIVSDFDASSYADGDIASYFLIAEARAGGSPSNLGGVLTENTGPENSDLTVVDIVFADGDGDGARTDDVSGDAKHSVQHDYQVFGAVLSIIKTSSVFSDPINSTTNPKRIPGAVIQYAITISNGEGAATASSVAITDSLALEITNGHITFNPQYGGDPNNGFSISHPDYNSGAFAEYTNIAGVESPARGGVEADWNMTTSNVVTVTGIELDADESATIRFRVTITQ